MTPLRTTLQLQHRRITRRPVPAAWIEQHPRLGDHESVGALVATIQRREHRAEVDSIIRALIRIASHDELAVTMLLVGLAPHVDRRTGAGNSDEFRDDLLAELALVILEADGLDNLDRLPRRLAGRAQRRAKRRHDDESRAANHEVHLVQDLPGPDEVAELAVQRADLGRFQRQIAEAIDDGKLAQHHWNDYRDGRLAPALGWYRIQPDRCRTYRARAAIDALLAHVC